MKRFLAVSGAILRKDCRHLWPQAAPTAALVTFSNLSFEQPVVAGLLQFAAVLICASLIVRSLQSDSAVSVQHDWLTRPIPWLSLLVAKGAFMLLWIVLPDLVGATLQGLRDHYSLAEALLEAVPRSVPSPFLLVIVAAAVCTTNMWQAMLVLVATGIGYQLAMLYFLSRDSTSESMYLTYAAFTGTSWILEWALISMTATACLLILWRQYGPRKTAQARVLYGAALLLMSLVPALLLPASRSFAVQRKLARDPAVAAQLDLALQPGCFTTKLIDSRQEVASLGTAIPLVPDSMKRLAGPDAVIFGTVLTWREPASDGRLLVAHATAKYLRADGSTLSMVSLLPARPQLSLTSDGRPATKHYWLLPRAQYDVLAKRSDVRLQIDYSLSMLEPSAQVDAPPDGHRRFYPGLGYCGVRSLQDSVVVSVDCFKPGPQPAWLLVSEAGAPLSTARSDVELNFRPPMLGILDSKRHKISLPLQDLRSSRVRITAYEARAHFDRRLTVAGILGGSKDSCPAPVASGT